MFSGEKVCAAQQLRGNASMVVVVVVLLCTPTTTSTRTYVVMRNRFICIAICV